MKVRFISWFLFILCTKFVTILGFEGFPTLKIEDFNLSKPISGWQLHVRDTSKNVTNGLYEGTDKRKLNGNQEIVVSLKGQKGKGPSGGGNEAHHPRSNKGATSFIATELHVSLALMGLLLPFFLTGF